MVTERVTRAVVGEYNDDGAKIRVSYLDVDVADNADYADDAGDDSADKDDGCQVAKEEV